MPLKIKYNAPVIISYTLVSFFVVLAIISLEANSSKSSSLGSISYYFSVGGNFDFKNPVSYFRLFSHIFGHIDWNHFFNNFMFILLIGPILEEKYGSNKLILMILVTALISGIIQTLFFSSGLLGASGVLFMMIILVSMSNFKDGEIPITFIFVIFLYLGKEFVEMFSFQASNISHSTHIIGGICGAIFGFLEGPKK